ncbi:MAG: hypothetical protein ACW972_00685 [Promethearchaeota archaeon]|jgi:hypothetical protein
MSEEEKFKSIIQEIKDIYQFLIQGEPTPDDEIDARASLIELIQNLKNVNSNQVKVNLRLFEDVLTSLENWDTLDLWFTESEIPDFIKKIINLTDEVVEVEVIETIEGSPTLEAEVESTSPPQIDIEEIVEQVSDKFKGEIDNLKQKIDFLKHEIDEKDEKIKQASQKKVIKITPKKNVKLPPPRIKIPSTKKPEKPPQILGKIETEIKEPKEKIGVKSIESVEVKIKEEIDKLKPIPTSPLTPPPLPPPSQPSSSTLDVIPTGEDLHEEESDLNNIEGIKPVPIRHEPQIKSDKQKESTSILDILDEQEIEYIDEEPEKIEEKIPLPKKPIISTEVSLVEEESVEQKKPAPFLIQDLIEKEKPEPFLAQTPKISSVSVEEIEAEPIKSTGTELFDVFSSVGDRRAERIAPKPEFPSLEPTKDAKKKGTKKKKKEGVTTSFIGFDSAEPQTSIADEYSSESLDELPKDKDSLYQELIALEGRRYSLEKTFKELERSFNGGSISDLEYKNRSDDLKSSQEGITSRINRIRRLIASL